MISTVYSQYSNLLRALSHPRRLEIVHLLRDQELCVGDIYSMLDLPQANISQHLLKLRQAKVVKTRRCGKYVFYSLKDLSVLKASDLLRDYVVSQNTGPSMKNNLEAPLASLTPLVHDPVCRMQLSPKNAGFKYHYRHRDYYFCASGCLKIFQKHPRKYA